jgi:insertion element IS1 protein InsB
MGLDCEGCHDLPSHCFPRRRPQWPERCSLVEQISAVYQERALFYTDYYTVYTGVIPSAQHRPISKLIRKTNHVERFNCTLRQRVSRLVRATLSFSKKLSNHIGAIRYFICDDNLTKGAALPG